MKTFSPDGIKDLSELIEDISEKVKDIEVVKLSETDSMTQLLVFIRTEEPPHYHAEHDLSFILLRGYGELYLDGRIERLEEEDIAFIPRGAVHFYRNSSSLSILLATFSPKYDGKDSVRVEL